MIIHSILLLRCRFTEQWGCFFRSVASFEARHKLLSSKREALRQFRAEFFLLLFSLLFVFFFVFICCAVIWLLSLGLFTFLLLFAWKQTILSRSGMQYVKMKTDDDVEFFYNLWRISTFSGSIQMLDEVFPQLWGWKSGHLWLNLGNWHYLCT